MTKISDFQNSKKAKKICRELVDVIALVHDYRNKLSKYDEYIPVKEIVTSMLANELIMEIHLNKLKKLIK